MSLEMPPRFVDVYLESCAAAPEGLSMRFKSVGDLREVRVIQYESELGLAGEWRVFSAQAEDPEAEQLARRPAAAVRIEDSSDGTAWLIVGGTGGLALEHVETGRVAREPYLVLSKSTELS